jgi:hypothetical protein
VKVPKSSWAGEGEGSADSQLNLWRIHSFMAFNKVGFIMW